MFHNDASFDDEDIAALIQLKHRVWQEQEGSKTGKEGNEM
jgi:hypothetical protein